MKAAVSAQTPLACATDEDQASAGSQSGPTALLHP
jgi:hypothetical protein